MPDQSSFDVLEASFRLLCEGPSPLSVHGGEIGPPIPDRTIPLTELGALLLHPSTPYAVRDHGLAVLVRRAKAEGGAWTVGLVGVLLPGLRAAISDVARAYPDSAADLEADVLAGLLDVLASFDPETDRIGPRLVWCAAARARRRAVREEAIRRGSDAEPPRDEADRPCDHPDFILAEAVEAGVLSADQAELIGETRLGNVAVEEWAARMGWQPASVRKRRSIAERRLLAWIRTNREVPCRESASAASFKGAGRSPVAAEPEQARVAPTAAGSAREVSPLARRLPATGAACPGLEGSDRRSA